MTFITYIVFSKNLDRYYVGHTGEAVEERIRKHNSNHKGYTGPANDWVLVFQERFDSKEEAYAREREIKAWKSRKMIEQLFV